MSALYPLLLDRFLIVSQILPRPLLQLSHKISLLIGLMLIMISKEIFCKVKRAYYITIALLILGGIFTFIKGYIVTVFSLLAIRLRIKKD